MISSMRTLFPALKTATKPNFIFQPPYVVQVRSCKPQHMVVFLTIEIALPPQDIKNPRFSDRGSIYLCAVLVCLHQHELTVPALCPIDHEMRLWDIRLNLQEFHHPQYTLKCYNPVEQCTQLGHCVFGILPDCVIIR